MNKKTNKSAHREKETRQTITKQLYAAVLWIWTVQTLLSLTQFIRIFVEFAYRAQICFHLN